MRLAHLRRKPILQSNTNGIIELTHSTKDQGSAFAVSFWKDQIGTPATNTIIIGPRRDKNTSLLNTRIQRGSTSTRVSFKLVNGEMFQMNQIPLLTGHHWPVSETLRWRADDGTTLNALGFFRGSGPVLLRNPIALVFSRGPDPLPPSRSAHVLDSRPGNTQTQTTRLLRLARTLKLLCIKFSYLLSRGKNSKGADQISSRREKNYPSIRGQFRI